MKGVIFLSALALLASSTALAQFTVDYVNDPPASPDRLVRISVGESRTLKDWVATRLTFESSFLFNGVEGSEVFVTTDPTGGAIAKSILMPAFTPNLTSLEWSLQTALLALVDVFGRKIDSDDTYTTSSRCWQCSTCRDSGGWR